MKNVTFLRIFGFGLLAFSAHAANAQWVQTSLPSNCCSFALMARGSTVWAGTSCGTYRSLDNGANWSLVDSTTRSPDCIMCFAANDSFVFAGTELNGFLRSDNNGASWRRITPPDTAFIKSMATKGNTIFASTGTKFFSSPDNGANWMEADAGLPAYSGVISFALSGDDIFAALDDIYRSSNGGVSWTLVNTGPPVRQVYDFLVMGGNIFAGTASGIFLSTDNGASWTATNSGWPLLPYVYVLHLAASGSNIFAIIFEQMQGMHSFTNFCLFISTDNGKSWREIDAGLPDPPQTQLIAVNDSFIIAAESTWDRQCGTWRRPVSELVATKNNPIQKGYNRITLDVCSQGCNSDLRTISFDLPCMNHVSLNIFDISGNKISSLVNGVLGQGLHSLPWDTKDLHSGTYLISIKAGTGSFSKSLSIIH